MKSSVDIALPDGAGDDEYLAAIADALGAVRAFGPDLVLYDAGVDVYRDDVLGRLAVTDGGICRREMMVLDTLLYSLLGLYLERVLPSRYGTQQHPLFFLLTGVVLGGHCIVGATELNRNDQLFVHTTVARHARYTRMKRAPLLPRVRPVTLPTMAR